MGIYDKYQNLKKAEKEFVWAHPLAAIDFNANATVALEDAAKRFRRHLYITVLVTLFATVFGLQ